MSWRAIRGSLLAGVVIMVGCKCLPVPSSDNTPPLAGMVVEYTAPNGRVESRTLSAQDPATTMVARQDKPVTVIYTGSDQQGVKSVHLDVTVHKTIGGGVGQTQHWDMVPTTLSCPKSAVMNQTKFDSAQGARTIVMKVTAQNWVGTSTTTQAFTVQQQ